MSELNIQAGICNLMVQALNKHRTKIAAARSLEITRNMLDNRIKKYNIVKYGKKYESKNNTLTR